MYPTINQLNIRPVALSYENWLKILTKPIPERPNYSLENGTIQIGQVLGEFLGVPIDVDDYYNQLFDYVSAKELNLHLISSDLLNKQIDNSHFQSIQKVVNINQEQSLSINRFTAFLDGERLLLKSKVPVLHRKLREAMILTLELFQRREQNGLQNHELRRVLVDVVKWSYNHLAPVLDSADPQRTMPKFLWYGDVNKSQQYFLFYLIHVGCDLVIFHPEAKDVLAGIMEEPIFIHYFQQKLPPEPFPTEKRSRKTTVAYRASKEIETILHQEGSGLYKSRQLRDYIPLSLTLKTTYDELFIVGKEIAMIRPDFEVKDGLVKIPSIFAKIHGVSKDRKEYWERLHSLSELPNSYLIRKLPFTIPSQSDFRFHYRNAHAQDGRLDIEKVLHSHYWPYSFLPLGLQKGIAHAIKRMCEKPRLKPLPTETMEEVEIFLFTQSMFLPKTLIQLLERFDYSQEVPKCIIFNNETTGMLSRSDAAMILLLNQFGIDVVLYNPTGHNDMENYLEEHLFDHHWLEDVVFDLPYKEPTQSLFKRGFLQGFLKNLRGD
ncbi:YceG family protein [Bacillus rubiinfantis]|uniref:YceG family protein n=1 Tax=Bacillus rubiinfantis TaxID=1499680 RepID=UPI0005AA3507|nr:YceG family protein [Bacillus rubiinfantis]